MTNAKSKDNGIVAYLKIGLTSDEVELFQATAEKLGFDSIGSFVNTAIGEYALSQLAKEDSTNEYKTKIKN